MGLRRRFDRFCMKNRDKGIPNLTLYMAIGTFLVTLLSQLGYQDIYEILKFDRTAILHGQVWRLVTFIFTMRMDVFSCLILLYCIYSLGRAIENMMGTFRFNLYYLSGILLMDIFGIALGGFTFIHAEGQWLYFAEDCSLLFAENMAFFHYLSLLLCFATLHPDAQFLLLFLIPIKAWLMALFYFILLGYFVLNMALNGGFFPQCLFPLVALGNYFLFFGKDIVNVLPESWRYRRQGRGRTSSKQTGTVSFDRSKKQEPQKTYTHRCTVCGRTDATNPELEFRYCSRCSGYFCYCQDHINNHKHIEE